MGALLSCCLKASYGDVSGISGKHAAARASSRKDTLRSLLSDKDHPSVDGRKSSGPPPRSPDWARGGGGSGGGSEISLFGGKGRLSRQQTVPCPSSSPPPASPSSGRSVGFFDRGEQEGETSMPKGFNADGSASGSRGRGPLLPAAVASTKMCGDSLRRATSLR